MQARETKDLQAEQNERTEKHYRHAAGYKPKTVRTSLCDFSFAIPQVRVGGFIHPLLKRGYALNDL
jgi:hypothetical protein